MGFEGIMDCASLGAGEMFLIFEVQFRTMWHVENIRPTTKLSMKSEHVNRSYNPSAYHKY
jgi:hypothetical protein